MSGTPFAMDLSNQVAQTKTFLSLVEEAAANNKQMMAAAGEFQTANRGQMAQAAQQACDDCITSAQQNNEVLRSIAAGLQNTHVTTTNTELDNAAGVVRAASGLGTSMGPGHGIA